MEGVHVTVLDHEVLPAWSDEISAHMQLAYVNIRYILQECKMRIPIWNQFHDSFGPYLLSFKAISILIKILEVITAFFVIHLFDCFHIFTAQVFFFH